MLDRAAALEDLLDRFERPTRRGPLVVPPAVSASGANARCGDTVTMYVERDPTGRPGRVRFEGGGCTISQVAADVTAELAERNPTGLELETVLDALGREVVGTRLDCAGLGLKVLREALSQQDQP